ncbi:hypothetical protein ACFLUE_02765 [Chloroflexota bacterium]
MVYQTVKEMYKRAVQIVDARFGLISNKREIIYNPEYFESCQDIQCLLTDIHRVDEIPFSDELDAYVYAYDFDDVPLTVTVDDRSIRMTGNIIQMEAGMTDRRYSLFGNLGLFFRYAMATLERYHGIFSFHASAMYNPAENDLILIVGSAGAGKTCVMLEGLKRNYQMFSTEMTHFKFDGGKCLFYKGSLIDNVRIGNFVYDFPEVPKLLGVEVPEVKDVWGTKIVIDLSGNTTAKDVLVNPDLTLLFPKIEEGREKAIFGDVTDERKIAKLLFDNATEKIAQTPLYYDSVPVGCLDSSDLMQKRLEAMQKLASGKISKIRKAKTILASPTNCMKEV